MFNQNELNEMTRRYQDWNAQFPMLVTLAGRVMAVRLAQLKNARLPMLVTPLGIVMLVSPVQ